MNLERPQDKVYRRMSKHELAERLSALQASSGTESAREEREEELQAVLHELEVYQIELEMQLRELRESRQALEVSLDRYASLYDFAPLGYVTLNDQGLIKEVNLTAAGMLGIERKFLIDRYFAPWIAKTDLALFRSHLKQCRLNSGIAKSTLRLMNREKQILPVELTTSHEKDVQTGADLFRTAIIDLTDRRSAEADLDRFFNLSGDLLCILGTDGRFKRINPASEKILGYAPSEMIGRLYIDFIHPDDRDLAQTRLAEVRQEGLLTSDFQVRYMRKDRSVIMLSWNSLTSGNQIYAAGRDITAQAQAKKEIERYVAKLKEERMLRERFVSALTHDLRTPLTSAKLNAQILGQRPNDPAAVIAQSKKISKGIDRADRMIQDLLDANRIKAGEELPMQLVEFDLTDVARSTLDELSSVYGKRFVLKTKTPVVGSWSKQDLRRVIENLANNAVKYGDPDREITISIAKELNEKVALTVQNFGNPIPKDEQLTLFKQFRRSTGAQKSGKKGWGIGLTLVRGIVKAHGGEITVESNKNEGTTFRVILPLKGHSEPLH